MLTIDITVTSNNNMGVFIGGVMQLEIRLACALIQGTAPKSQIKLLEIRCARASTAGAVTSDYTCDDA